MVQLTAVPVAVHTVNPVVESTTVELATTAPEAVHEIVIAEVLVVVAVTDVGAAFTFVPVVRAALELVGPPAAFVVATVAAYVPETKLLNVYEVAVPAAIAEPLASQTVAEAAVVAAVAWVYASQSTCAVVEALVTTHDVRRVPELL